MQTFMRKNLVVSGILLYYVYDTYPVRRQENRYMSFLLKSV